MKSHLLPLLSIVTATVGLSFAPSQTIAAERPPNVIIILADDLGYGDLACYGHPSIRTPNLDKMAAEGIRFTDFYASAVVCTPSRAALMTGRLPVRSGMTSDAHRVLFPESLGGLPKEEITIADALKKVGYATACVGKWHLGHRRQFLPTAHGFDQYFGIPYSNDMDRVESAPTTASRSLDPKTEWWNVPLIKDDKELERPIDQHTLTRRYTEEAVKFIDKSKDKPFFLYFAHTFPHVPLFASKDFAGRSPRGLFGDVVEEVDWSVGQVLETLKKNGIAENTFVFFTSDNGPWLIMDQVGGSAGLLKDGKGSTWEGGQREPGIAWWPGKIKPAQTNHSLACNMDLFPTIVAIAGAELPKDREIDGISMVPMLLGTGSGARDIFFYYRDEQLFAIRKGPWKAHYFTQTGYGAAKKDKHEPPLLYNVVQDPSERFNLAKEHPEVIEEIEKVKADHESHLVRGKNQLDLVEEPKPGQKPKRKAKD